MLYENVEMFKDTYLEKKYDGKYNVEVIGEVNFGNKAKARVIPTDAIFLGSNVKSRLNKISCFADCDGVKFVHLVVNKQKVYFKLKK
jgi:hypothetical protein